MAVREPFHGSIDSIELKRASPNSLARVQRIDSIQDIYFVCGVLDEGKRDGVNEPVVDERIRGSRGEESTPCTLNQGRAVHFDLQEPWAFDK